MKTRHALPLALALSCWAGHVAAQDCPAGSVRQTSGTPADPASGNNFNNFILGNTICAARGGDRWQEQHRANSELWDYKRGSDPIDPTQQVGTWSAANGANATVTHTYGGVDYVWAVCRVTTAGLASDYTLVSTSGNGGANIENVRILMGAVSCP